jgi:glucan phosphoethanolaminetransferase (alkaline phosphatase superfamily)
MNELTASGNLQLSDKIMTLYFIGVLYLLSIVLAYRNEMLVRCVIVVVVVFVVVVIAAVTAAFSICSEDICPSCFLRLHMVWIMLHKHYTC